MEIYENKLVTVGAMYSTLCTQALLTKIAPMFTIPHPISCEFLCKGLNDSYKITTENGSFLLRIYRKNWRTKSDIEYELSILNHLYQEGVNVAFPISTMTGDQILSIGSPEGERFAIMTRFSEGKPLSYSDPSESALYGKSAAKIHQHSDNYIASHSRFKLDLTHLIEEPLDRIKPHLKDNDCDWHFLKNYATKLAMNITNSNSELLDFGFCHGDFHGGNAHIFNGNISFFDFDCCGVGLRAYDLAVFKWGARLAGKEKERWEPFINGYREIRNISDQDLALVDDFVSIRHIWLIGLHIDISLAKGWLNESYFARQIKFLKSACEERGINVNESE